MCIGNKIFKKVYFLIFYKITDYNFNNQEGRWIHFVSIYIESMKAGVQPKYERSQEKVYNCFDIKELLKGNADKYFTQTLHKKAN